MKVLRISKALIEELKEIEAFIQKTISEKNEYKKAISEKTKTILKVRKLYTESMPTEQFLLNNLLLDLNEILRFFIIEKLDFNHFAHNLDKLAKLIETSVKDTYYDFFKLCGRCASCCKSPYIFSFEHNFIDKLLESQALFIVR